MHPDNSPHKSVVDLAMNDLCGLLFDYVGLIIGIPFNGEYPDLKWDYTFVPDPFRRSTFFSRLEFHLFITNARPTPRKYGIKAREVACIRRVHITILLLLFIQFSCARPLEQFPDF
jgi:hypothetical protein